MAINRYKQLLTSIPKGAFYASDGQVLPFRDTPYQLRLTTSSPNSEHAVYTNDNFRGVITTDADGLAVLSLSLDKGENAIKLVSSGTQKVTTAYITTREYATMLAGIAEVVESLDAGVEQVLADARLESTSVALVEQVFGKTVETANSGYDLSTYRELLQEIRAAYRHFGGTTEGVSRVVRAYTQVSPLIYKTSFGPQWGVGADLLYPQPALSKVYPGTGASLPNSQGTGAGISVVAINGATLANATSTFELDGTAAPKRMRWTLTNPGPWVDVASNGTYTLQDGNETIGILAEDGPYNISAGNNDKLTLEIGNTGRRTITLTAGAARTAADVAADINAALGGDYSSVAYVYGTTRLALRVLGANISGQPLTIHCTVGQADAAMTLFNLPRTRAGVQGGSAVGDTALTMGVSTSLDAWPDATPSAPLRVIIGRTTYHPPGTPNPPSTLTSTEIALVTNVNKATRQLTLASGLVYAHNSGQLIELEGQLPYTRTTLSSDRSITVNVINVGNLPSTLTTDSVQLSGTGLPTGWIALDSANTMVPAKLVSRPYFPTDRDVPFSLSTSVLKIPIPDTILAYKGFKAQLSVWAKRADSATGSIDKLAFTWDSTTLPTLVAPSTYGLEVMSTAKPMEYRLTSVVPPNATRAYLHISISGSVNIHRIRLTIPGAHGGLSLGSGTVSRNETHSKQGELVYVWCPDALSAVEKQQLGVGSTTQDATGHIDTISQANAWLDKFYTTSPAYGAFTDTDFDLGVSDNMTSILRNPARFSYLQPSVVSEQNQTVVFSAASPYTAPIGVAADMSSNAILFENGIPLMRDEWMFVDETTIKKVAAPDVSSTYTVRYNSLIRFTTSTVDLGASYLDNLWFVDYHAWLRPELVPLSVSVETGIQFDGTGVAKLAEQSDGNQLVATLTENTGLSERTVPISGWSFINKNAVQIGLQEFNQNALYSIKYTALSSHPTTQASIKVEMKSAAAQADLAAATWYEVKRNDVLPITARYHMMRMTISGVRDIRDVRLQSLLIKGLNMFGTGGTVPVLR